MRRAIEELFIGIPFTQAVKQSIREIADGNPALLHHACYLAYEQLRYGNTFNKESFIQDLLENTLDLLKAMWEVSTEEEQGIMMLVALYNLDGK